MPLRIHCQIGKFSSNTPEQHTHIYYTDIINIFILTYKILSKSPGYIIMTESTRVTQSGSKVYIIEIAWRSSML